MSIIISILVIAAIVKAVKTALNGLFITHGDQIESTFGKLVAVKLAYDVVNGKDDSVVVTKSKGGNSGSGKQGGGNGSYIITVNEKSPVLMAYLRR